MDLHNDVISRMNRFQQKAVALALVAIVGATLYPPWRVKCGGGRTDFSWVEYSWLFEMPDLSGATCSPFIDYSQLGLEYLAIAAAAGALLLLHRLRASQEEESEDLE